MNKLILLLIILIIYTISYNMKEYFNVLSNNNSSNANYNNDLSNMNYNNSSNTNPYMKVGKDAIIAHNNYSLLNDPLFKDVIYYDNNIETGRLGLDVCIEYCNGNCVEYGQTGNAYCFPNLKKN